ncbi:DUF3173 family protein [Lapidilactobacillus achengensis]|uniref:DUF3173 family protein n=1 Tax=Lapidilactobacillus achengensis TaxID=2486000 RepID=A0ABW1UM39_9LACO|nr:DUF3173 family protein [Lapidilactobacillus achengensis]
MVLPSQSALFISRQDLISYGFGEYEATQLLRMAKANLVKQGLNYYAIRGRRRVPASAVEQILGCPLFTAQTGTLDGRAKETEQFDQRE